MRYNVVYRLRSIQGDTMSIHAKSCASKGDAAAERQKIEAMASAIVREAPDVIRALGLEGIGVFVVPVAEDEQIVTATEMPHAKLL